MDHIPYECAEGLVKNFGLQQINRVKTRYVYECPDGWYIVLNRHPDLRYAFLTDDLEAAIPDDV